MDEPRTGSLARTRRVVALGVGALMALTVMAVAPAASFAQGDAITVSTASSDLGTYLVGPNGMTLYAFTRDVTPGVSTCVGGCRQAWPPLTVAQGQAVVGDASVTGTLGVITAPDGTLQATYRGRPLYYWQNDKQPGDTTGEGVGNVWFVASVDGKQPPNPPALTLATATTDLGTFLTGQDGMTLYMFANDATPGVSTCTGACLNLWPPATVPAGNTAAAGDGVTGVIGLIPQADGSFQVAYDGHPLYYYSGDTNAGDTNGQGFKSIWWVADVSGNLPSS